MRPALFSLLLGTLLLRMLVPVGYMVGADAAGTPALVLCDGYAPPPRPAVHAMRLGHHVPHHDPARHGEAPCPYAALATPVLPPLPPLLAAPAAPTSGNASARVRATSIRPASATSPPPSTGPPLRA